MSSPATQAAAVLNAPAQATAQAARHARIAKAALILRQLAIAAAALARVPGAGAASDTLHRALDLAVNRGGRFKLQGGKLYASKPAPPATMGADFLPQVAPTALRTVESAVYAARLALGRFGENLGPNLATATAFATGAAGKTDAQTPAAKAAMAIAQKALGNARALLGPLAPGGAASGPAAPARGAGSGVVWRRPAPGGKAKAAPVKPAPSAPGAVAVRPAPPAPVWSTGKVVLTGAALGGALLLLKRK